MKTSEDVSALIPALCKAQAEIKPAKFNKQNTFTKSKYADLGAIQESCKLPLILNGLLVIQDAVTKDNRVDVTTRIVHSTGQWIESEALSVPFSKVDAHGVGAAITYGRRYSLSALLCISTEEDDDGNSSVDHDERKNSRPAVPPSKKSPVISEEQTKNIEYAMSFCTSSFKDNFKKHMKERFQATEYKDIPLESFSTVMNGINLHLANLEKEKGTKELAHV